MNDQGMHRRSGDGHTAVPAWAADETFEWSADKTVAVRASAYRFLTGVAETMWAMEMASGHPHFVPHDAAGVPVDKLAGWLANAQAERVARARLYYVEPPAAALAIQAGGDLRTGNLPIPAGLRPPAPYGMVLCPSGLGYSHDGMQLIAAHWGPDSCGGSWITWWADMREYVEWARQEVTSSPALWPDMARNMGLLHYIHCTEMGVTGTDAPPDDGNFVKPTNVEAAQSPEMGGAAAALLGFWYLLHGKMGDRERISPTQLETEHDRALGILPSKITRVYLASTDDPDRLWDYDAGPVT